MCAQLDGRPDVEIILLDDRSTDGSAEICEAFIAASHADIRLLRHAQNSGPSAARNTMLDVARGVFSRASSSRSRSAWCAGAKRRGPNCE
ncbi:glycosyltransferase [Sphingopyxis sp. JAI128]|uniref:glycosyltransferase family 2 protein n=1 Tax=Sphingopyxis sp. JAI128 TaxID=2723066 RepID=UPI002892CD17|nr:glycosyltransferase [Sphingopyxis sp. JAI128]